MKNRKQVLALVLAAILTLSLCACAPANTPEPTDPPTESQAAPVTDAPTDEPSAAPATEPPTEPEPTAPTEPHYFDKDWWDGETPEAKIIPYSGTVLSHADAIECTYELPHIDMPGDYISALNAEIYNTYIPKAEWLAYSRYTDYIVGNYLVIDIESYDSHPVGASIVEHNIYTIDIEKSRPAKNSEILEAAGMTEEEFREKTFAAMVKLYEADLEKFNQAADDRDVEKETAEFLDYAYPYFAEDGSLWVHGRRLTIAGQGSCNATAPLTADE